MIANEIESIDDEELLDDLKQEILSAVYPTKKTKEFKNIHISFMFYLLLVFYMWENIFGLFFVQ